MYRIRRVNIGKTAHLDALAHAAGEVYSRTLVFFWRTVRHQGVWLKQKSLMRLIPKDSNATGTPDRRTAASDISRSSISRAPSASRKASSSFPTVEAQCR